MRNPAKVPPEWRDAEPALKRAGARPQTAHRPPILTVTVRGNIFNQWASIGGAGTSLSRGKAITHRGHVHVYRDGTLIVKWDLDNQKAMKGAATRRILELIRELEAEGLL
ncbi:MAG: hypothetical protein IT180_18180 [Acidobacteria bacterium]|nr:hypothetical protein [Acidobacteriota bacterium]